jgi:DNA-binding NarL/FixJ family response regulator
MSRIRILSVARPGANLDSLTAVLPALVYDVALFHVSELGEVRTALNEHRPHLAIIDSEVGFQTALQIHDLLTEQYPETKIIILSDAAHWQHWKTISSTTHVLLKGFSTRRLKVTLAKALSTSSPSEVRPPV